MINNRRKEVIEKKIAEIVAPYIIPPEKMKQLLALIASEQQPMVEALQESQAMLKEYKGRIQFIKDMDKAVAHDNILERLSEAEAKIIAALEKG